MLEEKLKNGLLLRIRLLLRSRREYEELCRAMGLKTELDYSSPDRYIHECSGEELKPYEIYYETDCKWNNDCYHESRNCSSPVFGED